MIPALVTLNVLSALLPLIGLARLSIAARAELRRAQEAERDAEAQAPRIATGRGDSLQFIRMSDLTAAARSAAEAPSRAWANVRLDLALVGTGILLGAVANTWSLFA